ncbi:MULTISPECIES: hypothetical protein [Bacillus]|nr:MULTISPECIES: hypothetical protein [Bacillus]MED4408303.1 hypothetical protein [Bacillus licheniformis]TWK94007.1 hypothetical protein CHCC20327_3694 [Bacillus licheniformis]
MKDYQKLETPQLIELAGEYWFDLYKTWKKAFEMASENGAVEFY